MDILLVNNNASHLEDLQRFLSEHNVTTVHFTELTGVNVENFDVLVLSGGPCSPVDTQSREYEDEMNLIRENKIPIFGVCLGFEMICMVFGNEFTELNTKATGILGIDRVEEDNVFAGINNGRLKVFQSHKWAVKEVKNLIPLAKSPDGIEIVKHPEKMIYGTQFHPEVLPEKTDGSQILKNFLKMQEQVNLKVFI